MFENKLNPFLIILTLLIALPVNAQEVAGYKYVQRTIVEEKPVKLYKWVEETVAEKQTVTSYKQVMQTETRNRKTTEFVPVRKTIEHEERTTVRKPVIETKFRKKQWTETSYETVTEMQDKEYTVRKPVIKTEMREERYTVRKPVTERMIEVKETTTYKPVLQTKTELAPGAAVVADLQSVPDYTRRPRMQWLAAGYYTDPATGQQVYRRRGLHWVQPSTVTPVAATVPALVPQEKNEWTYVPEVKKERKPVELTRYVDQVETRKVPVEIEEMVETIETRKVPVEIKIPRTKIITEDVPYTETTYRDEVTIKKVPITETTYKKVESVEPYTVEVPRYLEVTKEIQVPKTVRRRVEYEEMRNVSRVVMFKVPVDDCGNEIGDAIPAYGNPTTGAASSTPSLSVGEGSTSTPNNDPASLSVLERNVQPMAKTETSRKEPIANENSAVGNEGYSGKLQLVEPQKARKAPINVPDTESNTASSDLVTIGDEDQSKTTEETSMTDPTTLKNVEPPEVTPSGIGNEKAADAPGSEDDRF